MKNTTYWHVFKFFKCYILKREYLKIGNPGVKNILQALIFVFLAQNLWNFTVTCILSYWRTSACQIWDFHVFSFLWGEKGFFGITPWCWGFPNRRKGTSFNFFFVANTVLILSFSYVENALCYLSQPPWKTLDWATPKKYIFCSPDICRLFCKKFIHVSLWLF